jgi:hypothetical protein
MKKHNSYELDKVNVINGVRSIEEREVCFLDPLFSLLILIPLENFKNKL